MQFPSTLIALLLTIAAPLAVATPTPVSNEQPEPAQPSWQQLIAKTKRDVSGEIKAASSAALAAPTPVQEVLSVLAARSPGAQKPGRIQGRGMGKIARRDKFILPLLMEDMA